MIAGRDKRTVLNIFKAISRVHGISKEDSGCKERRYETSHSLDSLCEIETDFRVSRRTTDGEERIGGSLKGGETSTHDELATAEATK